MAGFSGIRFVDIRADTSCIGYVKLSGDNKKMVFVNGLINELNTKQSVTQSNPSGDSLVIFIKKFWVTRIIDLNTIYKEEPDIEKKRRILSARSFCHLTVAYFIKNTKGLSYSGKLDTILLYRKKLKNCYTSIADDAAITVLEQPIFPTLKNSGYFTEQQVLSGLSNPVKFPNPATMPNGIFLTYNDFKKGNIQRNELALSSRLSGYKVEFDNPSDQDQITDFWGVCYNNQFYKKEKYVVVKLNPSGNTFLALWGYVAFDEEAAAGRNANFETDIKALNKVTDSKYKKSDYDFVPLILDPLTGLLE